MTTHIESFYLIRLDGDVIEPGCYGDGTHGDLHVTSRLIDAIAAVDKSVDWEQDYNAALLGGNEMVVQCVVDEAMDALNDLTEGGYWCFHEGDFCLFAEDDDDLLTPHPW